MALFELRIAHVAYKGHLVECTKRGCLVTLGEKVALTGATPRLEIVGVTTVLDKANNPVLGLNHVTTDYCRWPVAMCTGNHKWRSLGVI
jgi:hypothetical protein